MTSMFALPTREAMAEHKRRALEDGYVFPLAATSIVQGTEIKARVRRLTTTDRAAIEALPNDVQATVWAGIKEFQAEQQRISDEGEAQSLLDAVKSNTRVLPAADALCIAAFIEPRLVAAAADLATHPGAYLVDDIEPEDRISFLHACLDADSASAKQLKLFRRPAAQHVPDRPAGGLDTIATIHPAQPAG